MVISQAFPGHGAGSGGPFCGPRTVRAAWQGLIRALPFRPGWFFIARNTPLTYRGEDRHMRGAMSKFVFILNGPNLNLLGQREPEIYGHDTLADVEAECRRVAEAEGLGLRFHQTNREYELIEQVHEAREIAQGIIINPAAFSHTSIALLDALNAFEGPVLEVHISNIHQREAFRHHSHVSARAQGVIAGFGVQGYSLAMMRMARLLRD